MKQHFHPVICLLLAVSLLAVGARPALPQEQASREYDIKAAFLYNFVKYVDLPRAPAPGAIVVGILGSDPYKGSFGIINGKAVQGRTLVVKYLGTRLEDPRGVDVLFINDSERDHLREIIEKVGKSGVLTVGETKGFAQDGGMINFIMDGNKVRFEVNPDAAGRANVKISSQLLRLARIVHG